MFTNAAHSEWNKLSKAITTQISVPWSTSLYPSIVIGERFPVYHENRIEWILTIRYVFSGFVEI